MSNGTGKDGRTNEKRVNGNAKGNRGTGIHDVNIEKIIELLKQNKILKFSGEGINVEFSPLAFIPEELIGKKLEEKEESIDDLLFFSTEAHAAKKEDFKQ